MDKLKQFFVDGNYIDNIEDLQDDDSLLGLGLLDSLGVQDLISFIEKEYGISVQPDDLTPDNFDSIVTITKFINSKGD